MEKPRKIKKASIPAIEMTLGRRHLRGTTQIAANAAALKNLFNGRHPPEFLPEAPGRPSKTVCKPFFQRTKGSLFCMFF